MTAIVAQRLPWRASWTAIVRSHLERTHKGMVTVPWPASQWIEARVYYNGRRWIASIRQGDRLPIETPCDSEREAKRTCERTITRHMEDAA